jgi:DNA-binding MarR family transcriptional regulator
MKRIMLHEDYKTWQDSIEPLSHDIDVCKEKLNIDFILSIIKVGTILNSYFDYWATGKPTKRLGLRVLHTIIMNGGKMPQNHIGKEISCSKYCVSRIVDDLEQRGLVVREPDYDDLRMYSVNITKKGLEIINNCVDNILKCVIPKIIGDIQKQDIVNFLNLLNRIKMYMIEHTSLVQSRLPR